MKISVFGNPDLEQDSLVVKMVPKLKKEFPLVEFEIEDPSEGLKPPLRQDFAGQAPLRQDFAGQAPLRQDFAGQAPEWIILDVAVGIDKIRVFEDLDKLVTEKRVSLHDYDVAMELKLLKRLGRVKNVKIVAVPMKSSEKQIINELRKIIDEK
jgi:hypothetical protein